MNLLLLVTFAIWFHKKVSSLSELYYYLNNKRGIEVGLLRKLEKSGQRLTKLQLDKKFVNICLDFDICPAKFKFRAPNLDVYRDKRKIYGVVLRRQLEVISKNHRRAHRLYNDLRNTVVQQISLVERICLLRMLNDQFQRNAKKHEIRHNKKLLNLWKDQRFSSPECLINLSNYELNMQEKAVLHYGLKHHILPAKVRSDNIKASIEKVMNALPVMDHERHTCIDFEFRDKIKQQFYAFEKNAISTCASRRNQAWHRTLKQISLNDRIKVCKFDKGNGTVILNSHEYIEKLNVIINDHLKFKKVSTDTKTHPVIKKQKKITDEINQFLKGEIPDNVIKQLLPCGSVPGKLYGLVKVHKPNNPLRPVVSMIGTPEYQLAKWLDSYIKPNICSTYMLNSTANFLDEIHNVRINNGDICVSFDVTSLFTNIPLDETIQLIADRVYSNDAVLTPPLTKLKFIEFMKLATSGVFMFNDELYVQTDGVAMGSPLAPTLANFFMAHIENKVLSNMDENIKPKFYRRYVDDCFLIFNANQSYSNVLNIFNSAHENLAFTVEVAKDACIPFLDVEVIVCNDKIETRVFRKKTNTNVILNWMAMAPDTWKKD